jgi:hypothetical protein
MRHAEAHRERHGIGDRLMPADVESITTKLAVVENEMKNLAHDVRGFGMALQQLVTRREVDDHQKHRAETHEALKERVKALEANQAKAAWAIIGAWLAGLGVAAKVFGGH